MRSDELGGSPHTHTRQKGSCKPPPCAWWVGPWPKIENSDNYKPYRQPIDNRLRMGSIRPPFAKVEASRPDFDHSAPLTFTKSPNPHWKQGQGGNDNQASLEKNHVEIDPYEMGRSPNLNYKLMISAVVPRPIGLLSTRSKDGQTVNLAPFSFTQMVNFDPPIIVVGITGEPNPPKDSLRNILETGECVVNTVSEHHLEAVNHCSINVPHGVSEFELSGLHTAPCTTVKAPRVKESIFSIEAKLVETKEWESRANPGKKSGVMVILEGTRFWAREDAINDERSLLDPTILRPVARLGGISYMRATTIMEIPRPSVDQATPASATSSYPPRI
ncbi:flavoprotein oxygenase [Blastomyces gilchristii SLH14081]|uniref:Flavoprotein oxygenase n=1 Tax=Blastomyces gilchristii (strain SLH14081) TaxID=559298 RepID=A0A179UVE8_BLAGS|nr:flavoprotein oxygenase [Blastomyces gilchristii SLH14081]OAT12095.1 flavoprotein oxygenase [Blastomyces gilchristii SLH14081]